MKFMYIVFVILVCDLNIRSQELLKTDVLPFKGIEVYGSFDVELIKSDKESVKLESATVDLSKIAVSVKKGILKIKSVQKLFDQEKQVKVIIEYKKVESILLSNGATVFSTAKMGFDNLKITQGNGSKIDLKVNVTKLVANIDKGAVLNLEGACQLIDIESSTGAIFNAYELRCDSAIVRANANGLIKINVAKYLDARASTGGDVSYRGIPKIFKQKTIMGGTIEKVMEYNSSPSQ